MVGLRAQLGDTGESAIECHLGEGGDHGHREGGEQIREDDVKGI